MEPLIQMQIFYEIAMSIGNSLDLGKMLKEGLSAYLRKLNCSAGVVFEMRKERGGAVGFAPIFSIPRNLSLWASQDPLGCIPNDLSEACLPGFLQTLPVCAQDVKARFFHLMELPGFGLLLLVRSNKDFSPLIIRSLDRLNRKLADACIACVQNMKIESINQQLTHEVLERQQAEAELRKVLGDLEQRVEDRTRELKASNEALTTMNQQLNDDITERKHAEEALRRNEEKYRELVENANSIILRRDKTGKVTFFNEFAQRFFGYSEQEILGKNVVGTFVPFLESATGRDLRWMIEDIGRNPERYAVNVNENMRRDGERVWIAWTNKPIFNENGEVVEVLCIGNDITERKRAQDELFNSSQMLQSVLDNIPQRVLWKNRDSVILGCNKAYALERGFIDPGEVVGKSTYEVNPLSAENAERYCADDLDVMQTGRAKINYEEPVVKPDGSQGWIITSKVPMFDRDGRVIGVLATSEDITERKQAETALRESEELWRTVIENIQDVFYRSDEQGVFTLVSPSALGLLGLDSLDDILGAHVDSFLMCPKQLPQMLKHMRENGAVRDYEVVLKKKDGSPIFVATTSTFRKDEIGNILGVEGIFRDITERKRAEEERMRLVTAIEQSADAIVITDSNFIIDYVNPAFTVIAGYEGTEVIGRHLGLLKSDKHERAFYRRIRETLAGGQVWSGRLTNRKKDGSLYETEATASPVRNKSGAIINYVSIHRDITRQVKLERDLRQAQKMEAIGTLAGGIAHDFNNILAAIVGHAEMARFRLAPKDPVRHNLDQVLKAGTRAADLVKRILAFSRQSEQRRQSMPIVSVVKEALKLLRPSLPTTIEIRTEISLSLEDGTIFADPTEIHQVLLNLCSNAAHAMRAKGGVLLVGLSQMVVTDFSPHPDLEPGHYVCLTVSDTGNGIDPEVMERIFDPYFTTKRVGEGTGLGLSVVQGIVRTYGGAIAVQSDTGKGTTFECFLRGMEKQAPIPRKTREALTAGAESILFVDDENILAELGKELLESLGYKVITRTNSLEALETFRADPLGFDLVITDMTMPGLRGEELAREILALRPEMPVILCSGYSDLINEKQARDLGIREFVMKPYMAVNFAETIRKVLKTSN